MNVISKKILLIGNIKVGKTSILNQYFNNSFSEEILTTIGIEFKTRIFKKDKFSLKLQIWDTSGQERFKSLTQNYFRDADGLLYVFDVTNEESFHSIEDWLKISEKYNKKKFIKILIGNKTDLDKRIVNKEDMEKFKEENKMEKCFETSAKNGEKDINKMFEEIADLLIKNEPLNKEENYATNKVTLKSENNNKVNNDDNNDNDNDNNNESICNCC